MPRGRPVGSKNNKAIQWERLGTYLTYEGSRKALTAMNELEGKEFLDIYMKILRYFKPQLSSAEIKAEVKTDTINLVVDEELKQLLENGQCEVNTSAESSNETYDKT